jgi:hypothetical protein
VRPVLERAVSVAVAVLGQLLVAYEAVNPEVDDFDFEDVVARLKGGVTSTQKGGFQRMPRSFAVGLASTMTATCEPGAK